MATTQQRIDLRTAQEAATAAGLDCEIEASGDDYTITMDTGEVETVTGLPGALRVIEQYAAFLPPREPITAEDEDSIREWLNVTTASVDADGDVWVEGPCTGHWLSEERKAEYRAWRAAQS